MIFKLGSARLLSNLIRFTRHTSGLARSIKKPIFLECRTIQNLNELSVRYIAVSAKEKEEAQLNFTEKLERDIHQLNVDVRMRRVFKEDFQNVFENLKQTGEIKPFQMILLLKCCTKISFMCSEKERIRMAKEFWNSGEKLGVKFDKSHFNELLNVYVANNHKFSHEEFLNKMEKAGVEPDLMTFRYLLRASCQQGDINGAKNLLDKMKNLNIPIDKLDFNSLILAYSKIGDFDRVDEIIKIMEGKELQPMSKSYVHLLCGYIEHGKLEEFKKLFEHLPEKKFIDLSNWDLLEIIYTLALKKQESYIDMVMEKLSKNMDYDKQVTNCMQRLLHEKLDSTALKLLETIDVTGRSFNYVLSVSKYMLDHFVWYRSPSEILKICQILEEKGYARAAVGYCLKKIFFVKNKEFFMDFILKMKVSGLPVRIHYYWPVIIQASKKGNKELLSFLKELPIQVRENPESVYNVILPNYVLSKEWETDFEQLSEVGIHKAYSARHFMIKCLLENQVDVVEQLVANYPVHPIKLRHVFNILFTDLASKPDKVVQVVNILYNLYHDEYLFEKTLKNTSDFMYFDEVVSSLLHKIQSKDVIMRVLEGMLEKKMGVSSKVCSAIVENFPDQNMKDLVNKLSDPNLKIELNETLLTLKSDLTPDLNNSSNWASLSDCIAHMLTLVERQKYKQALEVGENFVQQNKGKTLKLVNSLAVFISPFFTFLVRVTVDNEITKDDITKSKQNFKKCLFRVSDFEQSESLIKNFIDLGMRLGILKDNNMHDNFFILRGNLHSNYTSRAFEIFKEILLTTGKPVLCEQLLIKCISKGETEKVQQITDIVTETHSRNTAFSYLVFALADLGEMDKVKKVLDTPGFVFQKDLLLKKLTTKRFSRALKNLIEVLKNVDNFDMSDLYKVLVRDYAVEHQIDEIDKLWLEIKEKNILDKEFLKVMSEFQQDKDVSRLYKSVYINFPKSGQAGEERLSNLPSETSILEDRYINALMGSVSSREASMLAAKFASLGDVDKTCSLLESYSIEKSIQKIVAAFLKSGKVNEYFKFLDVFASKGDFITLNDCFKVGGLIPTFIKNDEFFQKYKSLLLECTDKTNFSNPVISCFVICAKLPGKIADAEEILDKYFHHFKDLPFSRIKETVEMTELAENFYENILSSKKLKDVFSDHLHEFYNKIIALKYEKNKFKEASSYIKEAEVDKVKDKLDEKLIEKLEKKLERGKVESSQSVSANDG